MGKVPNTELLVQLRMEYERLLQLTGIHKGTTKRELDRYNATLDKVFEQFRKEVESRSNPFLAKSYYEKCKNFVGASTILNLVESMELVIEGSLHNAYSNKAHLQRVILRGQPFIFKYPQDLSNHVQSESVMRDVYFSEMLGGGSDEKIPGVVQYHRFEVTANGTYFWLHFPNLCHVIKRAECPIVEEYDTWYVYSY